MNAIWPVLVLLTLTCVTAAISLSLREMSRAKLFEAAERRGRSKDLEAFLERLPDTKRAMSSLRMLMNLAFVAAVMHFWRFEQARPTFYPLAVFLTSAILLMVFGVAIPDAWARSAGESLLVVAMPLLAAIRTALQPLVAFLRLFDGLVRRLAGVPVQDADDEAEQLEQEILSAVSEGEAQGAVDEEEKDMIESVIELDERQVGQIMTPRTEIVALPSTCTLFEARELVAHEGHSRIPIYEESLDHVLGVLYAKDLLNFDRTDDFDATRVMRKVPYIPETKPLRDLLRDFRQNKVHIAIVLDEYGGTAGLVTIEDIVEELIGEIADEFEPPAPESIRRLDDLTADIDARLSIKEVNDELGLSFPEDQDYETVGGFVFSTLGRIPEAGEELDYENVHIRVLDAEERKINRLRLSIKPESQKTVARNA